MNEFDFAIFEMLNHLILFADRKNSILLGVMDKFHS